MSTTKQLKVYKGIPTIITARARGYWDDKTMLTFDTAAVYDGLNCDISDSASGVKILYFANTTLPYKWDYSSKLATSKYCLAPSGQNYDVAYYKYSNFAVVGSPTINYETGVVEGFDNNKYIKLDNSIPLSSANSVEIVIKVNISNLSYINCIIGNLTDNYNSGGFVLRTEGGARLYFWATSQKTSWDVASIYDTGIDLQTGINYIKILWNGTSYDFYISTDNINWTQGNTLTSNPIADFIMVFGDSGSMFLHGSMDLAETYINIDNSLWWDAKNEYTYDNFTTTGSPTINADGIVSGFSRYNYISLPKIFNPGASTWEQQIKFTTGSSLSYQYQRLTGAPTDMKSGANIVIQYDKLGIWLTSTNSSWNIYTGDNPSASILQTNTTYWVKLIFDGSKYVLSYSTDGTNFTDVITANSSTAVTSTQAMSFGAGSGSSPFYGSIDLSESYINIDGSLWWKGGGRNIESLPGILYDYTDDGSSVTLDCYANGDTSVILTDDASYNGTYLGTVAIPAHSV